MPRHDRCASNVIDALTDDEMHAVREAIIRRRDELAAAGLAGETPQPDFIDLDDAAQKFGLAPYYGDWTQ